MSRITLLLQRDHAGSAEELLPLVYDQLRALAQYRLAREKPGQTLQPTALVHEAFMRIAGTDQPDWDNQRHFYAAASEAMRRILINQARRKAAQKHGGGMERENISCDDLCVEAPDDRLLQVEELLLRLEAADPSARQLVNLRYFVGMTTAETADALGVSASTVEREWRFIKSFLADALAS